MTDTPADDLAARIVDRLASAFPLHYRNALAVVRTELAASSELREVAEALEPLAALADAEDAVLRAKGCYIPAIHDGDDSRIASPDERLLPFLRKRPQPYYITARDGISARKALATLRAILAGRAT